MIREYCEVTETADISDYEPMIELFDKVDRLVDIMNGNNVSGGKNRDVEHINCPRHRHVFELFDVLRIFEEWKKESGGFSAKFITNYTYEDLVWMVFGIAAAATYLKEDRSLAMHQGRSGSDVREHFFSQVRYINSNPTMQQACEGASRLSGSVGMDGKTFTFNDRKSNSGAASKATAAELLQEIKKDK